MLCALLERVNEPFPARARGRKEGAVLYCQRLGGAVEWLEHDGLLVPFARSSGVNLVIFTRKRGVGADFEIVGSDVLER
jgi:hypothetical protein